MSCRHLRNYSTTGNNWSVASCAARNHLYIPSVGDLAHLCDTNHHERCPYFRSRGVRETPSLPVATPAIPLAWAV